MRKIARRILPLLAACASLWLPSLAGAQTVDRAKLVEDAKKEGKLVVYAAYTASDANAFKAAFEKKYPFIQFEYFRAGKDKLLEKYLTEVKAGQYLPDVYQSSIFPTTTLMQRGLMGKYPSPERGVYLIDLTRKFTRADVLARLRASLKSETALRATAARIFRPRVPTSSSRRSNAGPNSIGSSGVRMNITAISSRSTSVAWSASSIAAAYSSDPIAISHSTR